MGKVCGICGITPPSSGLVRHYKEKHLLYYKLYLRIWVVKGIVAAVASWLAVFLLLGVLSFGTYSFSAEILAPGIVFLMLVVWVTIDLYLRKVRRSLNPSRK